MVRLKNRTTLRTKETRRSQRPPLSTVISTTVGLGYQLNFTRNLRSGCLSVRDISLKCHNQGILERTSLSSSTTHHYQFLWATTEPFDWNYTRSCSQPLHHVRCTDNFLTGCLKKKKHTKITLHARKDKKVFINHSPSRKLGHANDRVVMFSTQGRKQQQG